MSFIALLCGIFWWDIGTHGVTQLRDTNGFCFFITTNLVFSNVQSSVLSFPLMRVIMVKEYNSNMYGIAPFFLAKNIVDLAFDVFIALYFGNLVFWTVGLNTTHFENVAYFFLIALLAHMAGGSLGFLTGSVFPRADIAMAFTQITMVPFMYFSGFYRNGSIPTAFRWIEDISVFKYAFQGFASNQYDGNDAWAQLDPTSTVKTSGDEFIGITMPIRETIGLLALLVIVIRVLALIVLQRLVMKNKA